MDSKIPGSQCYFRKLRGFLDFLCTSIDNENQAQGYVRELQRFEVYFGVRILYRIFGQVHPVHNAIQSEYMSLGECSSIVAALPAALRIDGESVDIFSVFMTSCKSSALAIDLPAVPRGLAKRVNRGNRVDWEIDDIAANNYYHGIWTKMYNSLVGSLTKRFQGKAIDIAQDFLNILSNISEDSIFEFPSMNSLIELCTTDINWKMLKLEMIQWKRLCKIANPTKHTTDLKYLHKYLSEKSDHRIM